MRNIARQWGFFATLLAAVLANGPSEATTVLFLQGAEEATVDVGNFPFQMLDPARRLALHPPDQLPPSFVANWPEDNALIPLSLRPAGRNGDRPSATTDFRAARPSLSEGEMTVWKSSDETENRLFRMQFGKASVYEAPEPSPLIPIPEPATGLLVLMGIAGRTLWTKYAVY